MPGPRDAVVTGEDVIHSVPNPVDELGIIRTLPGLTEAELASIDHDHGLLSRLQITDSAIV